MNTNKIRQIPVAQGKDLVGIVTDRDIRSFLSGSLFESVEARENELNTKVREIMTTEPMTVSADDDLQEAVELMIEEKIGGIPVVDQAEGLVGIVTLSSAFFVNGGERQSADSSGYLVVHPPGR